MKRTLFKQEFFSRDALEVARNLLGACLCRRTAEGTVRRLRITEVEAYVSGEDKACHASKGLTPRTAVMFGPAGHWYIYLCYGMHWMLNIVTMPKGHPAAVLIRGADTLDGPGKLTRELAIDSSLNAKKATRSSGLWLEQGSAVPDHAVIRTPRIGVNYAGPDWAQRPYRFLVGNTHGTRTEHGRTRTSTDEHVSEKRFA